MSQNDLKQIGELVRSEILKNNFMLVDLIDVKLNNFGRKIEDNLGVKMLKWKSEIVDSVDILAKEMRDEREFMEVISHQTNENTKDIDKLNRKVFGTVRA